MLKRIAILFTLTVMPVLAMAQDLAGVDIPY